MFQGIRSTEAILGIFNHNTYSAVVEIEFVHTFHSDDKEYLERYLLTEREKEILMFVSEDYDTNEIAEKLFISRKTVGNHRSNMIEKLGARDSTPLVQLAKMAEII